MMTTAQAQRAPLLELKDLRTEFHTRDGVVRAVDGVSFEIHAGETVGLVGESGCGKSATALSVMRLIASPPGQHSGAIWFDGRSVLTLSDRELGQIRGRQIAMVFQDPMTSLNPVLTIGRQIETAISYHLKTTRAMARTRAVELLDLVGIPGGRERLRAYPHQFSGGMRQRVMIAMALSCRPKLVLADEITTALDVTIQAQILELLRGLAGRLETAFLLITHDLGIVAGMTQRVHVMYAGRIVETAPTPQLFADPQMPYTWGLLRSMPRVDQERGRRLVPIEGMPPNLISPPSGCRFEPRCAYRREICRREEPELLQAASAQLGHEVRCWGTQNVAGGGWLRGINWRNGPAGDPTPGAIAPAAPSEVA